MIRRLPRAAVRNLGLGLAAATPLLAGCGGASVVSAPTLSGSAADTCRTVLDALPDSLLDSEQHDRVADAQVQWGDPPVVLTCGVPQSGEVEKFSACSVMGGVQWYIPSEETNDPDSDVPVHTLGTDPVVRVDVPVDARPKFDSVIAELAPVLKKHLKVVNRCQ